MRESSPRGLLAGFGRRAVLRFIILLGTVGFFANVTYEGARSSTGSFLADLGASGMAVGVVAGLGELLSYALRLLAGYVADRTGKHWAIMILGYAMDMAAVPLLALTNRWEVASALMLAERVGKGIRTPVRDAMLSHATHEGGHGWGFGLHEVLDQSGAVVGPLVLAAILHFKQGYRAGFGILLVPALLTMAMLVAVQRLFPHPHDLEAGTATPEGRGFPKTFWLSLGAASLIAAGFVDFPLIAYHFEKRYIVPLSWIPISYALAMGVDALAALAFGRLFDRRGLTAMVAATLLSSLFAPLVFRGTFFTAMLGMALWGIGMGTQKTIMRAVVAGLVPAGRRGSAYGLFGACFGVAWLLGSALKGWLYDVSLGSMISTSIIAQLTAVPLLLVVAKRSSRVDGLRDS
ncbi:MAG: MFS transporter [Singulisphaera sp.]|nr:MFS transporter [Singulisphaera sp.]